MENSLGTLNVLKITGNFVVPAYQRGYRWGKEAITLLEDLNDFSKSESYDNKERYCLQPIVVKKIDDKKYELIDGQQRLTTLYLILKVLQKSFPDLETIPFSISYKVPGREKCKEFLETISENSDDSNIDFYFIKNAYIAIKNWINNQKSVSRVSYSANLLGLLEDRVDVIWYEVDSSEDGNTLFKNLNIGKIPLTNSELVKAMFLSNSYNKNMSIDKKNQIAYQWDNIEKELHNDLFWGFLSNIDRQPRIDLVLELISNKTNDYDKYASFYYFIGRSKEEELGKIWEGINSAFLKLKDWFNDHRLYHLIGYLIQIGMPLIDIFNLSNEKTKKEFEDALIDEIKRKIKLNDLNYGELSYEIPYQRNKIFNLLLLFNVISIEKRKNEDKFPFRTFKNEKWSLEHIHAQQSEMIKDEKLAKSWLELNIGSIKSLKDPKNNDLINEIESYLPLDKKLRWEKFLELRKKAEDVLSVGFKMSTLHSIGNLALLKQTNNSALSNSTFDAKRNKIIEMDQEGEFIPFCTRMVFLKYYTNSDNNQIHFWTEPDKISYIEKINETLKDYLDNQKIAFVEDEPNGND